LSSRGAANGFATPKINRPRGGHWNHWQIKLIPACSGGLKFSPALLIAGVVDRGVG
jgi:hypothetical protein